MIHPPPPCRVLIVKFKLRGFGQRALEQSAENFAKDDKDDRVELAELVDPDHVAGAVHEC